jgi:OOP family OmpA-OmpF porin
MRIHKVFLPLLALTALGLAGAAASGCHAEAEAKIGGAQPPPAPPPPEPPPPPATTAEAPPPPPPPAKKVVQLKGVQMKSATQIDMPGDIEYQTGSAKIVLNDKSKKVLTQLATIMKDNPEITKLRVEGHTDDAGEKKGFDNTKLSKERAQSVADWLTKNGVDTSRLTVVGWGSQHPLAANDNAAHMAENRRTEFHVQEFGGQAIESDSSAAPSAGAPPATASSAAPAASGAPASSAAAKDAAKAPKKKDEKKDEKKDTKEPEKKDK